MPVPVPTPVLRFIHVNNLNVYLRRKGMHAPNYTPNDGLVFQTNHSDSVQAQRHVTKVPCGPRGTVHDYVPFYFGPLSPTMFNLKTGRVSGYNDGQEPLIYLVCHAQDIRQAGLSFVFSDGHGAAAFTKWFDDLARLDQVDGNMVGQRYWTDNIDDMDRRRRKQAEFLVHQFVPWALVREIIVFDQARQQQVQEALNQCSAAHCPLVKVDRQWYYYQGGERS